MMPASQGPDFVKFTSGSFGDFTSKYSELSLCRDVQVPVLINFICILNLKWYNTVLDLVQGLKKSCLFPVTLA